MKKYIGSGLLFLFLVGCTNSTPESGHTASHEEHMTMLGEEAAVNSAATTPVALSIGLQPTLLRSYQRTRNVTPNGMVVKEPEYEQMMYRPRQFNTGLTVDVGATGFGVQSVTDPSGYADWDILSVRNIYQDSRGVQPDYLRLVLNRSTTLAVVWRPTDRVVRPSWLADWTPGGTVSLNGKAVPVYRKTFAAGAVNLGRVEKVKPDSSQNYFVLLGEQDGTPSQAPAVPAGRETPTPNQSCPAWVHDQYVAPGPDGKMYPTWHPEIDPVYWCYFGHEHGSDPSLAGVAPNGKPVFQPLYGYTAAQHGMTEPHAGFKTHLIRDPGTGDWWFWTVHMGSSGIGRVCQQFHTMDTAVVRNGQVKADIHMMGDFGRAKYVGRSEAAATRLVTGCPLDQNILNAHGGRAFVIDSSGYEPWTVNNKSNVTGLNPKFISFKTSFPATDCANPPLCTQLRPSLHGEFGTVRTIQYTGQIPGTSIPSGTGPSITAGKFEQNVGTFYTDVNGNKFVPAGSPMSVQQYVEPGFTSTMTPGMLTHCGPHDGWTQEYRCDLPLIRVTYNIEGAVKFGN